MPRKSELGCFAPIPGMNDIFTASNGNLRCTAVRLGQNDLCLFSPVAGLGESSRHSIDDLGQVTVMIAPNHYHNKALAEYAAAFPDAKMCADPDAAIRLEKVTGLKFQPLDDMAGALPGQVSLLKPDGLKTGEIWLRHTAGKAITWFVVDAFSGPKTAETTEVRDTPTMLGTFPGFGVRDKVAYADWVHAQLNQDKPTRVVPCHGAIVQSATLPEQLQQLVNDKLSG